MTEQTMPQSENKANAEPSLMNSIEIQERAKQMLKLHDEDREQWLAGCSNEDGAVIVMAIGQLVQAVTFWGSELAAQVAELNERDTLAEEKLVIATQANQQLQAQIGEMINTALRNDLRGQGPPQPPRRRG